MKPTANRPNAHAHTHSWIMERLWNTVHTVTFMHFTKYARRISSLKHKPSILTWMQSQLHKYPCRCYRIRRHSFDGIISPISASQIFKLRIYTEINLDLKWNGTKRWSILTIPWKTKDKRHSVIYWKLALNLRWDFVRKTFGSNSRVKTVDYDYMNVFVGIRKIQGAAL